MAPHNFLSTTSTFAIRNSQNLYTGNRLLQTQPWFSSCHVSIMIFIMGNNMVISTNHPATLWTRQQQKLLLEKITIYEKNHSKRENHLKISTHKTLLLYSTHLIIEERSKFIFSKLCLGNSFEKIMVTMEFFSCHLSLFM